MADLFGPNFMDNWVKEMQENAKKETTIKKVNSLIDEDPEWKEKSEFIDTQIKFMKDKIKELTYEKLKIRCEIGNKKLKEIGSTYEMKLKDPRELPFGDMPRCNFDALEKALRS